MPMLDLLDPSSATLAVETTVGNATLVMGTVNTASKGSFAAYGVAITGASVIDMVTARNTASRCLFGIGAICGAFGTVTTSFATLNLTMGIPPLGVLGGGFGGAFYWLGRKVNKAARVANIPAP